MILFEFNYEDKYVDLYIVNLRCVCLSIIVILFLYDVGILKFVFLFYMKVGGLWYIKCNLFRKLDFEVKFVLFCR